MSSKKPVLPEQKGFSLLTDHDTYLFKEGNHFQLYKKLGSHLVSIDGKQAVHFAVWAPNAKKVSVVGNFNAWNRSSHPLRARPDGSGIWETTVEGIGKGEVYKYFIESHHLAFREEKADPYALYAELAPKSASVVWDLEYSWQDATWMQERKQHNSLEAPFSIYEVHLGSWRRGADNQFLSYREVAPVLSEYVKKMGFTHVEFLPLMEHPFYGSWGYQTLGYFAPTSRYGTPQDFMYLIDVLHQNGIGVILDWVPSHFPGDGHGLVFFDGTHLYEHKDPRKGFHPDWKTYIFNLGRNEVRAFLISSALFWLEQYHIDCLRVDAVASMLYLDYSRKEGEWIPNEFGGRENLESVYFLRKFNEVVYQNFPDIQTIAEESTAWSAVSRPTFSGGLGFGMKWNMGWMHDVLRYFSKDPVHRKYHHNDLTFGMLYAFTENFILSLSHDEVVHGKNSLLGRMPGDAWQRFANLRLLYGFQFGHPGKKLLFMGDEFGQGDEWHHEKSLDWHLLDFPFQRGVQKWIQDLNTFYRAEKILHEIDFAPEGFEWVDASDWHQGVVSFLRKGKTPAETILIVGNFTPVLRDRYRIGVPHAGYWKEILNSDADIYGGSGKGNLGGKDTQTTTSHGRSYSLCLTLPPLAILFFKRSG